jgi:hypothetical protein
MIKIYQVRMLDLIYLLQITIVCDHVDIFFCYYHYYYYYYYYNYYYYYYYYHYYYYNCYLEKCWMIKS